ncbi:MAG: ABC transporter permease [Acidaminococcales bacterium]|jgi:D-methionine transport system permease protein|nr:ABC transporter permease [Acidaminococcales bacterium]
MSPEIIRLLWQSCLETFYMVTVSSLVSFALGMPLGVLLTITGKGHIKENPKVNQGVGAVINAIRSTPFIILMVAIVPFTRWVVGSSIGTTAAIVPLTVSATPFVARIVESSLKEVPHGVVEAALSMGSTPLEVIYKVLLPEALSGIILGLTLTVVSLIGYSAMAGVIGGGGLGDLAIRYGYQRFEEKVMIATVVILIFIVQLVQSSGDFLSRKTDKSRL